MVRQHNTRGIPVLAAAAAFVASANAAFPQQPPDFKSLAKISMTTATAPFSWAARQAMMTIPAGTYVIGDDQGPVDQRPQHEAVLPSFRMDRTEVTSAAFAEFLNALDLSINRDFEAGSLVAGCVDQDAMPLLRESGSGSNIYPIIALDDAQALIGARSGRFTPRDGYAQHPVTETTWAGAAAYCSWRRGRLPTEVEWEAAARGPDGRRYPWGNQPPTNELAFVSRQTGKTSSVGKLIAGASPFGILDMSGSLAEWTSSLKRPYPYDPADGREVANAIGERVTRGGDYVFDTSARVLTATHRNGFSNNPSRGHRHIGFRCVEDVH